MKLTIYSKKDCHLCEEAKAILQKYAEKYQVPLVEVDIEGDPALFKKYQHEIPVIFLDGRKLFKYHVEESKLEKALTTKTRTHEDIH